MIFCSRGQDVLPALVCLSVFPPLVIHEAPMLSTSSLWACQPQWEVRSLAAADVSVTQTCFIMCRRKLQCLLWLSIRVSATMRGEILAVAASLVCSVILCISRGRFCYFLVCVATCQPQLLLHGNLCCTMRRLKFQTPCFEHLLRLH